MASGPCRVLIADDSMDDRELIRRSLESDERPCVFEEAANSGRPWRPASGRNSIASYSTTGLAMRMVSPCWWCFESAFPTCRS